MNEVLVSHPADKLGLYFGERALRELRGIARVHLNPHARELTVAELADLARGAAAIVGYRGTPGTAQLFATLPHLKAFVRCATDIRTVDVEAASAHGVLVTRAGPGFAPAVAEWVIGSMIALLRHFPAYAAAYHAGDCPAPAMGRELRGSVLGIVGYGLIGREVARLAGAFGMRVLATDPRDEPPDAGVQRLALEPLLRQADVVVCLAAATPATENLMNAAAFESMRPGSCFINASRGALVDEEALRAALDSGRLAACALDVGRAPDQMPSPVLARHPRVLATPHIGGLTAAATEFQALQTVRQVRSILAGRVPEGAVNAPHATRCAFQEYAP